MAAPFSPFIAFAVAAILFAVAAMLVLTKGNKTRIHSKYHHYYSRRHYVAGGFSPQMELDLRLPYRRFKKLYPKSGLNYEAYKKLQVQHAFRRSMSSHDNKRMVR